MRPFYTLYNKILEWSSSRFAVIWLAIISFLESSILPYPIQDILLASMSLKRRNRAYYFAIICTLSSVLGAIAGYYIGIYAINLIMPLLDTMNYLPELHKAEQYFNTYGIWIILIAGFSPIPYKLFTISAGMMSMPLLPFVIFSLIRTQCSLFVDCFSGKKVWKTYRCMVK